MTRMWTFTIMATGDEDDLDGDGTTDDDRCRECFRNRFSMAWRLPSRDINYTRVSG